MATYRKWLSGNTTVRIYISDRTVSTSGKVVTIIELSTGDHCATQTASPTSDTCLLSPGVSLLYEFWVELAWEV
ncbi:MAG: hypothetical protein CM1200mP10_20430 [Candidatus Neomarinimicrobiota bacterium]|nr:MAG: hypothetical protein CM1200mP10_20430 [Candidatus Neomarinimicrobiota bacterium]